MMSETTKRIEDTGAIRLTLCKACGDCPEIPMDCMMLEEQVKYIKKYIDRNYILATAQHLKWSDKLPKEKGKELGEQLLGWEQGWNSYRKELLEMDITQLLEVDDG